MNARMLVMALGIAAGAAHAGTAIRINVVSDEGVGKSLGTVTVSETRHGLVLDPELQGLPPGEHGFHLHQNGSCQPAAGNGRMTAAAAAGGHFDPRQAGHHDAPWADGHLGDLPPLHVDADGHADRPVLAPRLKMKQLKGRALMIHQGGDNFSDEPKPLGGGGPRIACGVFE